MVGITSNPEAVEKNRQFPRYRYNGSFHAVLLPAPFEHSSAPARYGECLLICKLAADDGRSEVVMPTFDCHNPAGIRIGTRKLLARR
jgi:hypothetical protein